MPKGPLAGAGSATEELRHTCRLARIGLPSNDTDEGGFKLSSYLRGTQVIGVRKYSLCRKSGRPFENPGDTKYFYFGCVGNTIVPKKDAHGGHIHR